MALLDALRSGVKVIDKVTSGGKLQSIVSYKRKTGNAGYGPTFAAPVNLHALVDYRAVQVRTPDGTNATTRATLTLVNIAEVAAATGGNGISTDDIFTLPDGSTGPTLTVNGFLDSGTQKPVAFEVMLG